MHGGGPSVNPAHRKSPWKKLNWGGDPAGWCGVQRAGEKDVAVPSDSNLRGSNRNWRNSRFSGSLFLVSFFIHFFETILAKNQDRVIQL